jgi:hypothetical protein
LPPSSGQELESVETSVPVYKIGMCYFTNRTDTLIFTTTGTSNLIFTYSLQNANAYNFVIPVIPWRKVILDKLAVAQSDSSELFGTRNFISLFSKFATAPYSKPN